ncbi:alpha/beta hydrolase [Aeromicrobium sp.]|uniref:alpha/beta hydrolase n=1 Tax=Aeromicrobium sp. TaxID=1871063 RepID=UPI003513878B
MKRPLIVLIALAAVAAVVAGVLLVVRDGDGASDDSPAAQAIQPTGEQAPDGLQRFYDQKLTWKGCGGDSECATITVPIDYDEPDGATTTLKAARYLSTGDGTRVLFVNPGGPGGSAIDFAASLAGSMAPTVRNAFTIVGIDPRGVGESSPLKCLPDAQFDAYAASDPDPSTPAEVRELRAGVRELGEACAENSGELAGHVSTEEAARDMDVARAAMGQQKLDWFGASYGTQLGATYATLFPQKVGAMVLDGAVDPAQDVFGSAFGQATGFQRALDAYLDACAKLESCPLGQDPNAANRALAAFMSRLEDRPLPTGTDRELTKGRAFYGVAVTLYDKAAWPVLSQALTAALQGDGSLLLRLNDLYFSRQSNGSYDGNIGWANIAVNCLDNRERPSVAEVEAELPRFEKVSPVFGAALGWGTLGCTDWPEPAERPQVEIDAEGASPIVVIGTTRDPATPYENAKALADQLGDREGVLLTREGDGHTAYSSGNRCIVKAVDAYLVDGTVPRDGTTCPDE